jgi:hypothetical protein
MEKLILRKLGLGAIILIGLANPLRFDLDLHLDLYGDELGNLGTEKPFGKASDPQGS